MTDDIQQFVDSTLVANLRNVRQLQNTNDILFTVEPCASLNEGEISFITDGFTAPWAAAHKMFSELQSLGIHLQVDLPDRYDGDVKFVTRHRIGAGICKFAAPWYIDLYISKSQIDPNARQILRQLNELNKSNSGHFIFRGEDSIYPSVTSTLARYWVTNSADALRAIEEKNFQGALEYLQGNQPSNFENPEERERHKLDVLARIQHMGGVTNLLDFTAEIWVALFFACIDMVQPRLNSKEPAQSNKTGRIWMLAQDKVYDDLQIRQLDHLIGEHPNGRWERQSGVVVIPETGTISQGHLQLAAKIAPHLKTQLNEFLRSIGITTTTMYNDLEGYMRYDQDYIPLEALSHMAIECLAAGEYDRASALSAPLLGHSDPTNKQVGYYLRGLCCALQGQLGQARDNLLNFEEIAPKVPEYAKRNLQVVLDAWDRNRQRDYSIRQYKKKEALKDKMSLEVDEELWTFVLEGYTIRQI